MTVPLFFAKAHTSTTVLFSLVKQNSKQFLQNALCCECCIFHYNFSTNPYPVGSSKDLKQVTSGRRGSLNSLQLQPAGFPPLAPLSSNSVVRCNPKSGKYVINIQIPKFIKCQKVLVSTIPWVASGSRSTVLCSYSPRKTCHM